MRHVEYHSPSTPWMKRVGQFFTLLWSWVIDREIEPKDKKNGWHDRSVWWAFAKQTDLFWRTKYVGVEELLKDLESR